ncbi:MAG: DUF2163 domain-containing protein [Euryhalocaulis sp.]|uniref:DUF2163 domain-containing protein n=1 Tax=Euryhalocaulis sp. TaxID=2744307 RepID=UPI00183B0ACA|nr:DUF2163 domain-containing protein [Euryhalocaulis sp.]MBA4802694.1 DUF2163 domain-containing protein [Euryhalocaulis sp.]
MRQIPDALQAKLEDGVTTLCWCWRVERRDGAVFGFTSHDRDLSFDGADYRAQGGFEPGDIRRELGLSVDAGSVLGALNDDAITQADIAAGLWDEAAVTVFRVDWTEPEHRYAAWRGEIGETRRGALAFEAELRAPSHRLTQTTGRVYSRRCDADVGDARCGADLDDAAFKASGTVVEATGARVVVLDPALERLDVSGLSRQAPLSLAAGAPALSPYDEGATLTGAHWTGYALRPLSPAHLRGVRTAEGIEISWTRRTRIGGDDWAAPDVPLGETMEAYAVEIIKDGETALTLNASAPRALLANAQEIALFGGAASALEIRVSQLSGQWGAGAPAARVLYL